MPQAPDMASPTCGTERCGGFGALFEIGTVGIKCKVPTASAVCTAAGIECEEHVSLVAYIRCEGSVMVRRKALAFLSAHALMLDAKGGSIWAVVVAG